jgi:hypothetical protein
VQQALDLHDWSGLQLVRLQASAMLDRAFTAHSLIEEKLRGDASILVDYVDLNELMASDGNVEQKTSKSDD